MKREHKACSSIVLWNIIFVLCSLIILELRAQDLIKQTNQPKFSNSSIASNCAEITKQLDVCAKPMIDLVRGTISKWPKNDKEAEDYCIKYADAERCLRDVARRCTKGLERTMISTFTNSFQRIRKRECTKRKYPAYVKAYACAEKNQVAIRDAIAHTTNKLSVVSTWKSADRKTNGLCCMVHEIEDNIKVILEPLCPVESELVVKLYRGVMQDVLELVCRSPKCNDIFKGENIPNDVGVDGILTIMLNIVFSLDDEKQPKG